MDQTPNRGYPYPECEPPLVKDASDIAQMRDLAIAIDADVQGLYDTAHDVLVRPDACRLSMSAAVAASSSAVYPFYDTLTFDTTGTLMSTTGIGMITIVEPGWYMVGTWVQATAAVFQGIRVRFLQNGTPASSFSPQAGLISTNQQLIQQDGTMFYEQPGTLALEIRAGAASPSYTYASRIWAQQVIKL